MKQQRAGELFTQAYRNYLVLAAGADADVLAKTPDAYLGDLYGEITYAEVIKPVYEMLRRDDSQYSLNPFRMFQQRFWQRAHFLVERADEEGLPQKFYFQHKFFNADLEKAKDDSSLTWRELEILCRTSASVAVTLTPEIDREHSRVPDQLLEIYLGVLDYARGGTNLARADTPVPYTHRVWLQGVCELFERCYRQAAGNA